MTDFYHHILYHSNVNEFYNKYLNTSFTTSYHTIPHSFLKKLFLFSRYFLMEASVIELQNKLTVSESLRILCDSAADELKESFLKLSNECLDLQKKFDKLKRTSDNHKVLSDYFKEKYYEEVYLREELTEEFVEHITALQQELDTCKQELNMVLEKHPRLKKNLTVNRITVEKRNKFVQELKKLDIKTEQDY